MECDPGERRNLTHHLLDIDSRMVKLPDYGMVGRGASIPSGRV
jgi:hypothetical protein